MLSADTDRLDAILAALANPTRRAMLTRLANGEASVSELGQPFEMSQPAISRHVRVLEQAGLIARRVDGTSRPCRLTADGVATLDEWLAVLREALEANYGRLDVLLAQQQRTPSEEAQ